MEQIIIQWFGLIMDTFRWQLGIYGQWWAWAFVAIPAIATSIASLFWISILTSPIWLAFSGFKWIAITIRGVK